MNTDRHDNTMSIVKKDYKKAGCESVPYGYPNSKRTGVAARLTPKQRSGDLRNRLYRFLSLNGTCDLTGR